MAHTISHSGPRKNERAGSCADGHRARLKRRHDPDGDQPARAIGQHGPRADKDHALPVNEAVTIRVGIGIDSRIMVAAPDAGTLKAPEARLEQDSRAVPT